MVLQYNGVDLASLGVLRILAHTTVREPAEAPQRERVTYRVRLDFFEQTFQDNYTLIEQLWAALKTQNATLLWQDANGSDYIQRTVTAGDDESTDEALTRGGTYWQSVIFTFWFYNHDVVTNCLSMTFQRDGGGSSTPLLTFSTVEKWQQRVDITRYDDLRSARKLVKGTVTASGRIQGDTTTALANRQAALQELKDQFLSEISDAASGELNFGTFSRDIRVTDFRADVDQPNNYIAWQLTATFTVFPDESDYALIDVRIQNRENLTEGIKYFILSGRIGAPTLALATARLAELQAALTPAGYVTLTNDVTQPQMQTESGAEEGADQGDGPVFTEIQFNFELRDVSTITCTFQRDVANAPVVNLGTVDKFRNAFNAQLFDEMRELVKRASGTLSIGGKWYAADSLNDAAKQAAVLAQLNIMLTELQKGSTGELNYTTLVDDQLVRVIDFSADMNRARNCIEWSMTATFTRFPNEQNYTIVEIKVGTRNDRNEGTVTKTLSGRIGAPTADAARAKLAALRTIFMPNTFTLKTDSNEENRVSVASDGASPAYAFIEITVNEEWQQQSNNVLAYKLRVTNDTDNKTGWVRTIFAGTVTAEGTSSTSAFASAEAQADLLGDGKYPFQVRTSVIAISNQVLTTGSVIVIVEFSYEYQQKGTLLYIEVNAELNADTFGNDVLTVSGFIAGPSYAAMQSAYLNNVRNVATYDGALLLNERTTMTSQQQLVDASSLIPLSALDDRFVFSFQILQPKGATETAISYSWETQGNLQTLEQTTTIQGTVMAADEATAEAFLDTFLTGLNLGIRLTFTRTPRYQQGPQVTGGAAMANAVMTSLAFTEVYVTQLVGVVSGILMSECAQDVTYSGNRIVEKGIPDGTSILQLVGTKAGRRTVTARAISTTEAAADAWVRTIRLALLSGGPYEEPQNLVTAYKFLPQTAGVPEGESDNVLLFEVNAKFSEVIASLPFSP